MICTSRRICAPLLLIALNAGCSGDPTAPSGIGTSKTVSPALRIVCTPDPLSVRCAASVQGVGTVTSQTRWWATDEFLATAESSNVIFFAPGNVTAFNPASIYIRGEYRTAGGGTISALAPHSYRLVPGEAPVPLAFLTGAVHAAGPGDVTVEIVEGEGAGKRAVTDANGFYMIEHLRLGVPFTVRASKSGYAPDTKTNSGIIDDVFGSPANNTIEFTLTPLPPS